jgi:hypothetical protein
MAANLEPYTVAGKTGTALLPLPGGGYSNDDFVSSFAGFVPAEDPAITAMVVVNGTHQYGAVASAPVFATIVRDALQELGIPAHKAVPPLPNVPLATPYYEEGEAAGPILPGLSGAPEVQVGTASGGAASTTTSTTIATTTSANGAPTTTSPGSTTPSGAATPSGSAATTTPTTSAGAATTTVPTTSVSPVTATSDSSATTTSSGDAVGTTVVEPAQGQPVATTLSVPASTGQ